MPPCRYAIAAERIAMLFRSYYARYDFIQHDAAMLSMSAFFAFAAVAAFCRVTLVDFASLRQLCHTTIRFAALLP